MGFMGYVFKALGFESEEQKAKPKKAKTKVILSVESCDKAEAVRILDYFRGVVFGMNAKFIVLDEDRLYLMLPEGLEVEE